MMTLPRKKKSSYVFVIAYLFHIAHESQKSMNMLTGFIQCNVSSSLVQFEGM